MSNWTPILKHGIKKNIKPNFYYKDKLLKCFNINYMIRYTNVFL